MMDPMINAVIAEINTAPAAISLIFPAKEFWFGSTRSTKPSNAVLIISVIKTILMAKISQSQSDMFIPR